MKFFLFLIILLILILIIYKFIYNKEQYTKDNDVKHYTTNDTEYNDKQSLLDNSDFLNNENLSNNKQNKYSINDLKKSEYFLNNKFHQDYIDIINILQHFENISPNDKHLFNTNNLPVIINKNIDDVIEINKIGDIVNEFVENMQTQIKENKNYNKLSINKWNTTPEQDYTDGFEKTRKILNLPTKLYNKNVVGTDILLKEYSNINRLITEDEINYTVDILLGRDKSRDKIVFNLSIVINKNHPDKIIIENTNILGFITERIIDKSYMDINDKYNFDNLDENNMLDINNILDELDYKYNVKEHIMQDNIDNLHPEDKFMHMRIDPNKYKSLLSTQTITDDICKDKKFE